MFEVDVLMLKTRVCKMIDFLNFFLSFSPLMLLHNFHIFLSRFHLSFPLVASFQSPPLLLVSVDSLQHFIQTIHTDATQSGTEATSGFLPPRVTGWTWLLWDGQGPDDLSLTHSSPERGLGVVGATGLGRD